MQLTAVCCTRGPRSLSFQQVLSARCTLCHVPGWIRVDGALGAHGGTSVTGYTTWNVQTTRYTSGIQLNSTQSSQFRKPKCLSFSGKGPILECGVWIWCSRIWSPQKVLGEGGGRVWNVDIWWAVGDKIVNVDTEYKNVSFKFNSGIYFLLLQITPKTSFSLIR